MTDEECQAAKALSRQTTSGSLSEYARKTLLGKPLILKNHNQFLDDFMTDRLRPEADLKVIGTDFNQVVRRLHALKHLPVLQQWILLNEQGKTQFFCQIKTISNAIEKAYQLWSRD